MGSGGFEFELFGELTRGTSIDDRATNTTRKNRRPGKYWHFMEEADPTSWLGIFRGFHQVAPSIWEQDLMEMVGEDLQMEVVCIAPTEKEFSRLHKIISDIEYWVNRK